MNLFKKTQVVDLAEREQQRLETLQRNLEAKAMAMQQQSYQNQLQNMQAMQGGNGWGQQAAQGYPYYAQGQASSSTWNSTTVSPMSGHTLEFIVDMIIAKVEATVAEQIREVIREELKSHAKEET